MLTQSTAFSRSLDNGLILKSMCDETDVERITAFNDQIFGSTEAQMTRSLILKHPHTRPEHWLYIQDESTGQIVSSLALIPWVWRYEDVLLKSGEMGIVGTLEAYRNRGLIRSLVTRFKELLHDENYDLSNIQGIPYFYRQFGYEYAMPLEAHWHVELHNLPDKPSGAAAHYHCRRASVDDIPVLMQLYDEAAKTLDICAVRDAETWHYLIEDTRGSATESEFWLLFDKAGKPAGYWRIALHGFGKGLIVSEASRLSEAATEALLLKVKTIALERNKPDIRLSLPANSDLVHFAKNWNTHDDGSYAWQIHLVDVARLLRKLTPVLERRIASSAFNGLNEHVIINLYREAFDLHFDQGKLLAVKSIGFSDGGTIRMPPLLFAPLLLGYRSREALSGMYPDVGCWGRSQYLVDVLFPKLDSFIFSGY